MGNSLVKLYEEKMELEKKIYSIQKGIQYEQNKANTGKIPNKDTISFLQTCLNGYSQMHSVVIQAIKERRKTTPELPMNTKHIKKTYRLESILIIQ